MLDKVVVTIYEALVDFKNPVTDAEPSAAK